MSLEASVAAVESYERAASCSLKSLFVIVRLPIRSSTMISFIGCRYQIAVEGFETLDYGSRVVDYWIYCCCYYLKRSGHEGTS